MGTDHETGTFRERAVGYDVRSGSDSDVELTDANFRFTTQSRHPAGVWDTVPIGDPQAWLKMKKSRADHSILRPGEIAPRGSPTGHRLGEYYSITAFGRRWIREAAQRPYLTSNAIAEVLAGFTKFGDGYRQRAVEAVNAYRTNNYLACCAMCGAAAESILIALAIEKIGDEGAVLKAYTDGAGRSRITAMVIGDKKASVAESFKIALQVLSYWRDGAAHGMVSNISEVEAFTSLTQLLRLAQFSDDQWAKLTSN